MGTDSEKQEAGRRCVVGSAAEFVENKDELFKIERNVNSYFNWALYS